MKKSKFTEAQIAFAMKQTDTGIIVEEVCRKMGTSEATFYNWKKKYGGLGVSEFPRLRQLRKDNAYSPPLSSFVHEKLDLISILSPTPRLPNHKS